MAEILFESGSLPSLDTMYPKITPKCTRNMYFLGFKLIPNSQHLSKHSRSFGKWVSKLLNTLKSSKNNFMNIPIILESCIHHLLVSWWSILEPQWHHYPNESSIIDDESSLVPIC